MREADPLQIVYFIYGSGDVYELNINVAERICDGDFHSGLNAETAYHRGGE